MPWNHPGARWLKDRVVYGLLSLVICEAFGRETCTVRIDGDLGNFWFHGALKVKLFDAARDDLPGVPRKMNLAPFLATQVLDTIPHAVDVTRHVDCPLVEALQRVAADA